MDKLSLVTVEITFIESDENQIIGIGGPPDQARDMRSRVAEKMKFMLSGDDTILHLKLKMDEYFGLVMPILKEFPSLGWHYSDELPRIYRHARPSVGLHCVPIGYCAEGYRVDVAPCTISDYGWLNGVTQEGFDPAGPNGPTYWRVAVTDKTRYYSTVKRGGTFCLIVSELE